MWLILEWPCINVYHVYSHVGFGKPNHVLALCETVAYCIVYCHQCNSIICDNTTCSGYCITCYKPNNKQLKSHVTTACFHAMIEAHCLSSLGVFIRCLHASTSLTCNPFLVSFFGFFYIKYNTATFVGVGGNPGFLEVVATFGLWVFW